MIIQCESCQVSFELDASLLGETGRKVRCSKCGHQWHQAPTVGPDSSKTGGAGAGVSDRAPESDPDDSDLDDIIEIDPDSDESQPEDAPDQGEPPDQSEGERPEMPRVISLAAKKKSEKSGKKGLKLKGKSSGSGPALAAGNAAGRSRAVTIGWVALILFLAGSLGGALVAREAVVERFPHMGPLYAAIGITGDPPGEGLSLEEVTSIRRKDGDDRLLIIQGLVLNVSDKIRPVPPLRASLTDSTGQELVGWTFPALEADLAPGETTPFETYTKNPPKEGSNLAIGFEGEEGE
ncbi:MAG: DUF3426 domain-containing protein [Pseudomonadota bacterium]